MTDDAAGGEDPRVAAALADIDRLDDVPLADHVAVLSEAHRRLHALLAEPASAPASAPAVAAPEPPTPASGPPAGAPS